MREPGNQKVYSFLIALITIGAIAAVGLFYFERSPVRTYTFTKPRPSAPQPRETTLFFAGDVMLSRNVGNKIAESSDPLLPFRSILPELQASDLVFANLESPFLDEGSRVTQGMVFKAEPEWVNGLSGFSILQTANNHSADRGSKGLLYTNQLLAENGIVSVGTGEECGKGAIIERNGIKFGFLAYSYAGYNDGGNKPNPLVCDWNDEAQVISDIRLLKPQVDYLVVAPHMGAEYQRVPSQTNAARARAAVEAGADFVIGGHPHWIQTVERHQNGWIFYSLGNFVFDQMWSQDTREGLVVSMAFRGKKLDRVELKPVVIENYCCPRWADESETLSILKKINPSALDGLVVKNGEISPDWIGKKPDGTETKN